MSDKVLAFDFGASSGRAILGELKDGKITLEEVHRFDNDPVTVCGTFYWDVLRLFHEIKQGIIKAKNNSDFDSIGIDTWGVDYGMIAKNGKLLGNVYNYRDSRTNGIPEKVREIIPAEELYSITGIQHADFNTIFQLFALKEQEPELSELVDKILLMPDLFNYLLTGNMYAEYTNVSTTQLANPVTKEWNFTLIDKLGYKRSIFPEIIAPGETVGKLSAALADELDVEQKKVVAVCSHDTASAVAAVPTQEKDFVFISCGTWSLFGTELSEPMISDKTYEFNITNEAGYNKTTRFLKNIIGLWMIQETRRQFKREGKDYSYAKMEELARAEKAFTCFIDPDSPEFVAPGNIPERIREYCRRTNQQVPETDGAIIRCIYESLAMKYKYTFDQLKECCGKDFKVIHMVGGGTKDSFLCQMASDAANVPVVAGPIEGTAAGNVIVQFIANGKIKDLKEARKIIADSFDVVHYAPQDNSWDAEYDRFVSILEK